jgi:hypothetical protein
MIKENLRIATGQEVRFTVALPPQILFELEAGAVLFEFMPLILKQTFFGPNPMKGELGNFLPVSLKQEQTPSIFVHSELVIRNNAKTVLEPGEISIYSEPLNVYADQGKLLADTLEMEFQETGWKTNVVQIKNKEYRLVREGVKSRVGKTIVRHSAHILKHITHLGDNE